MIDNIAKAVDILWPADGPRASNVKFATGGNVSAEGLAHRIVFADAEIRAGRAQPILDVDGPGVHVIATFNCSDVNFSKAVGSLRRKRIVATAAAAALALVVTGCATVPPPIVAPSLLTCTDQPASPAGTMQSDASLFIIDLADAGQDCRTKLGSVRKILEPTNDRP